MEEIKPSQNFLKNFKTPKSKYWKFVIGFLAIVLVVFVGFPLARDFFYTLAVRKDIRDYFEWEKAYKADLKNDTFGGKTPQETYEMFLDTLEKGDILSAAKFYYRDEHAVKMYAVFKDLQERGEFEEWVDEYPSWEVLRAREIEYDIENSKAYEFSYIQKRDRIYIDKTKPGGTATVPAGRHTGDIIFKLNESANIWKVYR